MFARFRVSGLPAIALVLVTALPAAAQRGRLLPGIQQAQTIKAQGKLVSATPSQMQILTDSQQTIYVMIGQNTQVSIKGTAELEYLKSGLCVEFVAEVAKGGAVKDKIDHLVIVTPSADQPIGFSPPELGTSGKKSDKDDDAPAANGRGPRGKPDADPLLRGDPPSKASKARGGATQFPGTYTVRGTLKMVKNGAITVATGRGPTVKAELSSDATIDVEATDVRMAQPDDAVTVKGVTSQARPNMIVAQSVTVELASPLTGKKRAKPGKTPPARSKAKKDADAADAPPDGK